MQLHRSGEDYLEAIYVLAKEKGAVRSIDVAHYLDYSKPSVSRAVNNLKTDGYLETRGDGELVLTARGLDVAGNIYERHTLLTELFCSLGVSRKTALDDACRVEHAISEETFARLKATHGERMLQSAAAGPTETPAGKKGAGKAGKKKGKKKKKSKGDAAST